ncbi:MAG TPA: hypothetical protein VM261_14350, partial [Kofleriaceae bacterium]|nr:hypothetical protein [Kofleriaceae bacterium]
MLQRIAFAATLGLAACGGNSPATATTTSPTAPVALADPANESLGGVSLGDPAARAIAVLGEPTEKSEVQEWAAT